ncbi:unnamed protein product, partial [Mesorhabditis belari]|uniref:Fibronectin type-III domain-containing protein n=1 Tax=Mesorhabditis belari TaxID=2138241 RepID=A0AAF3FLY7_9BILA
MRQTERGDTGKYTLKAQNENGTDSATCNVTVIDKPSHPKAREDDGGVPLENYLVEKFDTATHSRWVPALKVPARQAAANVDGLLEGHEYKFRVSAVNSEGESGSIRDIFSGSR